MKLNFHINYKTAWGETLHALVYRAGAGANERRINIPLTTKDGKNWTGQIQFLLDRSLTLNYHYEVRVNGKTIHAEWQTVPRVISLEPSVKTYFVEDQWRPLPQESFLYTSCMTRVFRPHAPSATTALPVYPRTLVLHAQTARPGKGESLFICGSIDDLGKWDISKAMPMQEIAPNEWAVSLDTSHLVAPFEYKFVVRNPNNAKQPAVWEEGPNRVAKVPTLENGEVYHVDDLRPKFPFQDLFRAAGVVIPVFSLRSKNSWGVGDFGDLNQLTDWAVQTGQRVLQILPINDTTLTHTWKDSYPYNAVSVYAFHPIYADMNALPPASADSMELFEQERVRLNNLPQIDYEGVTQLKLLRLKDAFSRNGDQTLATPAFRQFFIDNEHWLPAYAMFCVLRDKYQTSDFSRWPEYKTFSKEAMYKFCAPHTPHAGEIRFWYYVQYILHTQLLAATRYAREHGVILKGDIPIGVSPHSVEAWTEPTLFNLNAQAGAPPDDFSATGQNWGFPTYNWDTMALDGYRWWMHRFTHMARYFDAYRVDHILGFFRIWEIPMHSVEGLLGQFVPALPFTKEEIARYGFTFKPEYTRPHITEELIAQKFGDDAQYVKDTYLLPAEKGLFTLRPEYDTQRKVEAALAGQADQKTQHIKQGLFALISNVLFVPDRTDPQKVHPRISALQDEFFQSLNDKDKRTFTELYNNYFYHRHNEFWGEQALKKLPPLIQSTRLLCCAEDLGMIPACVPEVMQKLQIISLEIQRMPKRLGETFADTRHYPYLSVATPSTHDMSVLRGWWKENPAMTQRFWQEVLGREGKAPSEADGKTCEQILRLHLQSPSMLALISWQDWMSMDETLRAPNPNAERINVPANPNHFWRYRMHLTLEELQQSDGFNEQLRRMIKESNR